MRNNLSNSITKYLKESEDNYQTYTVNVGWNGQIGTENEYNVGAYSKEDAERYAIEEATMDLSVDDISDNGDGSYTCTVNWCGFIGCEEEYTVSAEDEDEAEQYATEEAAEGLEVLNVEL